MPFFCLLMMSCLKLSAPGVSENNSARAVPSNPTFSKSKDKKNVSIKDIKFSDQSTLNLMTDVKVKFNEGSKFPLGSYLILKDEDDVIFLGRIDSRSEPLNLTVPFNLRKIEAKIVGVENGIHYLEKVVLIRSGVINI